MNERLKKLRKALGFTQQEFADRISVKRGTIANYEIGRNEPTDAVISLICREFNVNEKWLRTGVGEMFLNIDEDFSARIDRIMAGEDDARKNLFKVMLELSDNDIIALKHLFDKAIQITQSINNVDDIPDTSEELEKAYPPVDPKDNAG